MNCVIKNAFTDYKQTPKARKDYMYQDKTLVCRDCGSNFTFTAGEQEFFASRGFQNQPQRCKKCKDAQKSSGGFGGNKPNREMFVGKCAKCGKDAKVPFRPTNERPIYCSDCFSAIKK